MTSELGGDAVGRQAGCAVRGHADGTLPRATAHLQPAVVLAVPPALAPRSLVPLLRPAQIRKQNQCFLSSITWL